MGWTLDSYSSVSLFVTVESVTNMGGWVGQGGRWSYLHKCYIIFLINRKEPT